MRQGPNTPMHQSVRCLRRAALLCLVALALPLAAARAADPAPDHAVCGSLRNVKLVDLADAPTNVLSAVDVPAAKDGPPQTYVPDAFSATPIGGGVVRSRDLPAYCRVIGTVEPQVKFELRLPLDWNGKFLMQGCGGMCGIINMEAAEDALVRRYAVVNTNMGHDGDAGATLWARNDAAAHVDFGWRATHVVALAAKALIAEYYRRGPTFSYFRGYSTGGDQAMSESQRFPEDFNGILATAPAWAGAAPLFWSARASVDANGRSLLTPDDIRLVHAAVLKACGGEKDGYLADPLACRWQPEALKCPSSGGACLNDAEIGALRRIYDGARDASGYHVTLGMPKGSELEWLALYVYDPEMKGWPQNDRLPLWDGPLVTMVARDLDSYYDPGPAFSVQKMDFAAYTRSVEITAPFRYALNPDLRAFKAHGGKLILIQGWNDPEVPALYALDYYRLASRTMGGLDDTRSFFRLFFVPGMAHVRGGEGADAIDELTDLENWVEHGQAPDRLVTYRLRTPQNYMGIPAIRYPLAQGAAAYARPVYPYPMIPAYTGSGDYDDAANWKPVPGTP